MSSGYLEDLIILLVAAVAVVPICQTLKLGAVPGFLIAGLAVGPSGLGLIHNLSEIRHFAEIGIAFLLFVIGIELKPSRLWQMKRMVFGLGTLQVLITGLVLVAVSYYVFEVPLQAAAIIGPALALSSTAFVLQLLSEQRLLKSTYGRTSFSILLLQDLAVVPLLALVSLLGVSEISMGDDIGLALAESVFTLLMVILFGRYFLHPVLHRIALTKIPEVFTASAILVVLGVSLIAEKVGLSMAMGAFIVGMLMSDSSYKHQVISEIKPFRGLLLGLFFMTMGMSLNLGLLIDQPLLSMGLVALLIGIKILILFPLTYMFGLSKGKSLAVSLVLAQSGEFALVLFSLSLDSGILAPALHQQLLLVILISLLVTPILAECARKVVTKKKLIGINPSEVPKSSPIILAGFGRVGHRIGDILKLAGKPFVAIDIDPNIVRKSQANNLPVYYGDVCNKGLLDSVGVGDSRIVIVTVNDMETSKLIVGSLRQTYPDLAIYVRGGNSLECTQLLEVGASAAVSDTIEASIELAGMGLTSLKVAEKEKKSILTNYAKHYYEQIKLAKKN
ncbi:monovalent cation:proton antiporter-2 (CPA2) family protein [Cycloclasticus pugetii]|jgi:glutathione-regulated potassium-efflux system protein KefB|uniref:monovalent cation:proton antiporter-2 (CPA2) family protein n=1 Tax=Cycloclasticus pugetii TaxID=34068 RepID=UPI00090ECA2F|nr:monovalent cation:proton antiporter-2 (CPA2) family protein [Cycloclasticus pugetii]SHI89900.1 Kef-type potassium/proton antiporter, CPA2 family [Cycloclasticus pugetii]|tara:strand:- start:7104 stop:8786 length:1683 start_codon:yes stop_codon:yes gene_type:complete